MNPATEAGNRLSKTTPWCDDKRINLYVVSVRKFLLLYGLTAGGYMVYWSYRNWASYKAETGAPIAPLLRAALWPFFILPLFEVVQNGLDRTGRCYFWQPETRGLLIMLLVMFSVLVSTLFTRPSDAVYVLFTNAVLIAGCCAMLVAAQRAINILAGDPQGSVNKALSYANFAWMVAGTLLMAIVAYMECTIQG